MTPIRQPMFDTIPDSLGRRYRADLDLSSHIGEVLRVRQKFSIHLSLDKHYIKFGCPKPKSSCPRSFA